MLGIELVKDRTTKEPAKRNVSGVGNLSRYGLIVRQGGLQGQTIRFSPPMCIHQQDADFILESGPGA
jgi:alanine-glyoxylate transaminase/(R)-3-amino-2-methylpropionate-pyruvate transaminase